MNTDTLTTMLGIALAIGHQVGVVGTLPSTKAEWLQTLTSAAFLALGYLSNKPVPAPAAPVAAVPESK